MKKKFEKDFDASTFFGNQLCDVHGKLDTMTIGQYAAFTVLQGLCGRQIPLSALAQTALDITQEMIDLMNGKAG